MNVIKKGIKYLWVLLLSATLIIDCNMKSQVILIFFGALTLAFGGVLNKRFDPCLLTISGCNEHTTKAPTTTAPNVLGPDNGQINAKLVPSFKSKCLITIFMISISGKIGKHGQWIDE